MTTISVFGNELDPVDNAAIKLLPKLRSRFNELEFVVEDPTESITPHSNPWIIIDTAIGIDEVVMIEDLSQLEYVKGSSVHDYDVYMDLRLKAKLDKIQKVAIILVPQAINDNTIDGVIHELEHALKIKHQH